MSFSKFKTLGISLVVALLIQACGGGSGGSSGGGYTPPPPGTLQVNVTDGASATGDGLADVQVLVFDADTNEPVGNTLITDVNGTASGTYNVGSYYFRLSKQGYKGSPAAGISALPHAVQSNQTTIAEVTLLPHTITGMGSISGQVTDGTNPVAGVLLVATDTLGATYSTISDSAGNYNIYNTPADDYTIKGWRAGYNSDEQPATVTADTETPDIIITLTGDATASVSGSITFLAVTNGVVDVSLIHPVSRDIIPGTVTVTTNNLNYVINNVPDGDYIGRASFENDGYVMDPDAIVKFGEPMVTISGTNQTLDFDVTGSVLLDSPTNPETTTVPAVVDTLTPTLTWVAYPSTSDYVIEVINSSGEVIWGSFSGTTKLNSLASTSPANVIFNFDGLASEPLADGHTYRWRVYASKDDTSATGWRLISASEDQRGVFKVVLP